VIKSRKTRWAGHEARVTETSAYRVLVEKPQGKRPLRRPRHRWLEDKIRMDLWEIGWEDVDWIYLAQDRE